MSTSPVVLLFVVAALVSVLYWTLRSVVVPPRCVECNLDMIYETELPLVLVGPGGDTGLASSLPELRLQRFRCPRCGRHRRVAR